ncbi:MAG: hypothetical protein ACLTSK_01445 [Christensenellales bacterium]
MEKIRQATQQKINRYNEKLLSMPEKLAELMAEEEAKFGVGCLPTSYADLTV